MPILVHNKPHHVYKALHYAVNKAGAVLIGKTLASETPADIAQEILQVQPLNENIERHIYHGKLGAKTGTALSNELWEVIAIDLSDGLGYEEHPYILPRHTDQDHDHIHVLWSRTNEDGICPHDSWDHYKSQVVLRDIAQRYGLPELEFSWEGIENAPSFAEVYRTEQQQTDYVQGNRDCPPEFSVRHQLLDTIKENVADQPRLPELIERLQNQDIEVRVNLNRPGISFQLQGITFQGSSLGRGFSFNGLQKHFQVQYNPDEDNTEIEALLNHPKSSQTPELDLSSPATNESDHDTSRIQPSDQVQSDWTTIQTLVEPYQFQIRLIQQLYEATLLAIDQKKRLTFAARRLNGTGRSSIALNPDGTFESDDPNEPESSFWITSAESANRIVVVDNPLEVIAAYLIEENSPEGNQTLYLAAAQAEQIPTELQSHLQVYVSTSCNLPVREKIRTLVSVSQEIDPSHQNSWVGQWQIHQQTQRLLESGSSSIQQVREDIQLEH
ncbi:relaxase/mobilization nuclease domain-containing protein [Leptolyngbya sp. AN10]|uniref:relaxase/mobilization nuclease domain-containing protein n=1 Tax=Leptolyngbya sp. AN10 TaxID=3423365 RepID=UPI003D3198B7